MRVAIFTIDAQLRILCPAPGIDIDAEMVRYAPGVPYRVIDDSELPDRATTDRDKWIDNGTAIVVPP